MHSVKSSYMDKLKLCYITLACAYQITAVDGSQCQLVFITNTLLYLKAM